MILLKFYDFAIAFIVYTPCINSVTSVMTRLVVIPFKLGTSWHMPDFLELLLCGHLYACVCLCVCLPPRLLITSGVI